MRQQEEDDTYECFLLPSTFYLLPSTFYPLPIAHTIRINTDTTTSHFGRFFIPFPSCKCSYISLSSHVSARAETMR